MTSSTLRPQYCGRGRCRGRRRLRYTVGRASPDSLRSAIVACLRFERTLAADLAPILRLFARRFVPHTNGYSVRRRPGACAGTAGMAHGGFPCWQIGAGRCPEGPLVGCWNRTECLSSGFSQRRRCASCRSGSAGVRCSGRGLCSAAEWQPVDTGGGPRVGKLSADPAQATPWLCVSGVVAGRESACHAGLRPSAGWSSRAGSGRRRCVAGRPAAAAKCSNPDGVVICRACSGSRLPTRKVWGSPAGRRTKVRLPLRVAARLCSRTRLCRT